MENIDNLKLENQLCFPLYVCSKEIIRKYKPYLEKINLTYTQYIVMLVLWEEKSLNVKQLGKKLYLDSGTLTPLLKKLEAKKYIERSRLKNDERFLMVSITKKGIALKEKAKEIPLQVGKCLNLNIEEAIILSKILSKILINIDKNI